MRKNRREKLVQFFDDLREAAWRFRVYPVEKMFGRKGVTEFVEKEVAAVRTVRAPVSMLGHALPAIEPKGEFLRVTRVLHSIHCEQPLCRSYVIFNIK